MILEINITRICVIFDVCDIVSIWVYGMFFHIMLMRYLKYLS